MSLSYGENLLFTAYSMTSAFAQDGHCITNSGASTPLATPYSVAKPITATADPAQYRSAVATWFVNFLNVSDWGICGDNGSLAVHMANADTTAVVNVALTTTSGVIISTTSYLSPTSTASLVVSQSSFPTPASSGLSTGIKAAIGLLVSVVVLALMIPGFVLWYRYRKQRAATMEEKIQEKLEMETQSEIDFSRI